MMKLKLLFALLIFFVSGFVFGQSLVLTHDGTALDPNEVVMIQGSSNAIELIIELDVTNTGSASMDVLVQRYEENMVPGSTSAICWGGLCYPPFVGLSPNATTIPAGATVSNDFSGHYYPAGNIGMSTISFVFFDSANPNDSVMVTVNFDGILTGVADKHALVSRVYPNPANEYVNLDFKNKVEEGTMIELVNIVGAVIGKTEVSGNIARINTSTISEGIYFYRLVNKNNVLETGRIIVQH